MFSFLLLNLVVVVGRFMITVIIFLQNKVLFCLQTRLHIRLQNIINIDLLTHLPVRIARNLVENQITLIIPSNHGPGMEALLILLFWLLLMLYTVLTVSFTRPPDDPKLPLWPQTKVDFIREAYSFPILQTPFVQQIPCKDSLLFLDMW